MSWLKITPYLTILAGLGVFAIFVATAGSEPVAEVKVRSGEAPHHLNAGLDLAI